MLSQCLIDTNLLVNANWCQHCAKRTPAMKTKAQEKVLRCGIPEDAAPHQEDSCHMAQLDDQLGTGKSTGFLF